MKRSWSVLAALVAATTIAAATPAFAAGDAAAGEKIFNKCKACHSNVAGQNRVGPSLFGVVGRKSGTAPGFKYSDGMAPAAVTWDAANIDKWLTDTKAVIPGNKMTFALKDAKEREDVIAYLATVK